MALDRLTALFRHVQFSVLPPGANPVNQLPVPRLRVRECDGGMSVSFYKKAMPEASAVCDIALDFGGPQSPLWLGLPDELHANFTAQDAAFPIAAMVMQETATSRCGSPVVLDRLFEVLLILLLRHAIEQGQVLAGLLSGLADDHLKYALVAVHDNPGADWTTERLAELCHLSRTAFYQRFQKRIGVTPMHYVRGWRMSLAHIQLKKGDRIAQVAADLGYRSTEGFSRAFHQRFAQWPGEIARSV